LQNQNDKTSKVKVKTKPQKQAGGGKLKIDEDSRRRFMDETGCALADYSVAPGAHPFHQSGPRQ